MAYFEKLLSDSKNVSAYQQMIGFRIGDEGSLLGRELKCRAQIDLTKRFMIAFKEQIRSNIFF